MNNRQPINLAGKEYQIGFSFRAIKLFEELTGRSITTALDTWDDLVYSYCSLKAINTDFTITLDQFVDILDDNPELLIELKYGAQNQQANTEPEPASIKKKVTLKAIFGLWTLSLLLWLAPVLLPIIFGFTWIFRNSKRLYALLANRGNKPA